MTTVELTDLQAQAIKAIVNIFETGSVLGNYAEITLIPGDPGGLTYGRTQVTLNSGGLFRLVQRYVDTAGALFQNQLRPFLGDLERQRQALNENNVFHNLLRAAADDELMRTTQDEFFDEFYFEPAVREAEAEGVTDALGVAVIYDSLVHGSWKSGGRTYQQARSQAGGTPSEVGAREWIATFIQVRRNWLANHPNSVLHPTVYRMDAFQALVDAELWDLNLPFLIRGLSVSEATLNALPPDVFAGPPPGDRDIERTTEMPRGLDVRLVQLALSALPLGIGITADGIFGPQTERFVKEFQQENGLDTTGVVTADVFAELGITEAAQQAIATAEAQLADRDLPALGNAPRPDVPEGESGGGGGGQV